MIIKFKDSLDNWNYITLGNFVVNKMDVSQVIKEIMSEHKLDDLIKFETFCNFNDKITANDKICVYLRNKMKKHIDYVNLDVNVIDKMSKVVIVQNTVSYLNSDKAMDYLTGNYEINIKRCFDTSTYMISDECYLIGDNGEIIEKLM